MGVGSPSVFRWPRPDQHRLRTKTDGTLDIEELSHRCSRAVVMIGTNRLDADPLAHGLSLQLQGGIRVDAIKISPTEAIPVQYLMNKTRHGVRPVGGGGHPKQG